VHHRLGQIITDAVELLFHGELPLVFIMVLAQLNPLVLELGVHATLGVAKGALDVSLQGAHWDPAMHLLAFMDGPWMTRMSMPTFHTLSNQLCVEFSAATLLS